MKKAYTLVELIVIVVILIIISGFVFVYIGFYKGIKVDAAANKMVSDIRYAQSIAMSTAVWHGVSFEASPSNLYNVYSTNGTTDAVITDPSKFGANLSVNLMQDYGVSIDYYSIGGGNKIEFNPLGQPYLDKLSSALSLEASITISSGSYLKTIKISPNSGRVFIE